MCVPPVAERTEKLPLGSVRKIVSEPIKGHEEYHIMVRGSLAKLSCICNALYIRCIIIAQLRGLGCQTTNVRTVKPVYNGHCISRSPLYISQVTESQMGLQCAFQPALTGHLSIAASFLGPKGDHYRQLSLYIIIARYIIHIRAQTLCSRAAKVLLLCV